jgi:hypothetical protein
MDGIDRCLSNLNMLGSVAKSKINRCIVALAATRLDPSVSSPRPQSGLADTPSQLSWHRLQVAALFSPSLLCFVSRLLQSSIWLCAHCSRTCSVRPLNIPPSPDIAPSRTTRPAPPLLCHRPSSIWHDRIARPFRPSSLAGPAHRIYG